MYPPPGQMRTPPGQIPYGVPAAYPHVQSQSRSKVWIWAPLVGLLILGTVLLTLFYVGAFRQEAEAPVAVNLQAKQAAPPPALDQTAEVPEGMPQHIRDWLEHLRETERRKNELHAKTAASMRVFMAALPGEILRPFLEEANGIQDPVDSTDDVNPRTVATERIEDISPEWHALVEFYRSYPPPPECQPLADDYDRALSEIPAQVNDVFRVIASIQNDSESAASTALEELYKMQGNSGGQIDLYFRSADEKLGEICQEYNVRKWFAISADMPGGALSMPGF